MLPKKLHVKYLLLHFAVKTKSCSNEVSNTGTDVLRLIPGIHVDMMQIISLEGSNALMIFVDGRERDKSYVSRINPNHIDKIEIISMPPSNYDGNLTGAINIILKKDRDSGINGNVLAEIPTSLSEVYLFPTYNLSYGFRKLNLYISYNGEITHLNQHERAFRKLWVNSDTNEINTNQYLKQKNWIHRFHYGFDYFLTKADQINFYAYYNPYSRELDGNIFSNFSGTINKTWKAVRKDTDKNAALYYSLYYKHVFNKPGCEISSDISIYRLRAENRTDFVQQSSENDLVIQSNFVKTKQYLLSLKIDYSTVLLNKLNIGAGIKAKLQTSKDRINLFEYKENVFAAYGNVSYKIVKLDARTGLRVEKSAVNLLNSFSKPVLAFLPYTNLKYKLTSKQNIQLSYSRIIRRPNIYQLNPYVAVVDPFTVNAGNPGLKPEYLSSVFLDHSLQFKSNYFSSRLFLDRATNVINNLTYINNSGNLATRTENPGTLQHFGIQFSGSFKVSILTLNPYLKIFEIFTLGNKLAKQYSIEK